MKTRINPDTQGIDNLKTQVQQVNLIMVGVIVVLFVTLITISIALGAILIDLFRSKEISYQELINEIQKNNSQENAQLFELKQEITLLREKNPYLK